MVPAGYMAKLVSKKPDWLQVPGVVDLYSVSGCNSKEFADYIQYWKHNGYWLFDSPSTIREIAQAAQIPLEHASLFYYEVHEEEFDGKTWQSFSPEPSLLINVLQPPSKRLEGFDVASFFARNTSECSPLSCNNLATEMPVNSHCLLSTFEEAKNHLQNGAFNHSEPGPYRIFAVYSVNWPRP